MTLVPRLGASVFSLSRKGRGKLNQAPSRNAPGVVTLIDWQSAERRRPTLAERVQALAALHASLADPTARDRLRFLREYLKVEPVSPFAEMVRRIERAATKQAKRRSIRDQRQPTVTENPQRLVWLAGEAVCAVPEVAAIWPSPAVAAPFYGELFADESCITLADGRPAVLLRQRASVFPRLVAKVRGRAWRSAGATLGRILFHLERYGIPAPRLLAFGQLESSPSAESFVLFDPPAGVPLTEWLRHSNSADVMQQCESLLQRLHDAGCRLTAHADVFRVDDRGRVTIADPRAIRLDRKLSAHARRADFARVARLLTTPG
jgi:hypothetical protein